MIMEWFYTQMGQQAGPVDKATLQHMLATGQISANENVWKEGMASWMPASSVPELFAAPPAAAPAYGNPAYPAPGQATPVGYPSQGQAFQTGYPQAPGLPYGTPPQSHKGMAIGAMVCSICGLFCCGILAIVGPILGMVALSGMKKTGNNEGRGMAIAGIIIGIVVVILNVLYVVYLVSTDTNPFANMR
ncbi:MAG TPA: GYF domain-containing protein [Tepidisphaeraceae bacterium]|jgi:hypothetical protein|nr:GYF domain-containing protein [Tepidisphaeraceae bacterium]